MASNALQSVPHVIFKEYVLFVNWVMWQRRVSVQYVLETAKNAAQTNHQNVTLVSIIRHSTQALIYVKLHLFNVRITVEYAIETPSV